MAHRPRHPTELMLGVEAHLAQDGGSREMRSEERSRWQLLVEAGNTGLSGPLSHLGAPPSHH